MKTIRNRKAFIWFCTYLLLVVMLSCKNGSEQKNESMPSAEERAAKAVWIDLFDGKSFKGWHTYMQDSISGQWQIQDEALIYRPDPDMPQGVNNLVTDRQFTNFELALEWKISTDGNSGVFYGILEDAKYVVPYMTAPEIQIRDYTSNPDFDDMKQMSGAIFGIIGPERDLARPAGEWNQFLIRVDHRNNEGMVMLNGEEAIRFPVNGENWDTLVGNSKFRDWEGFGVHKTGPIGLQDHAHEVWFRNIRLRELD